MMKCANFDCKNNLTDFELKRISKRFSKYHLCIRCRRSKIVYQIGCFECGKAIEYDKMTSFCDDCFHENRLERERLRMRNLKLLNHSS